MNNTCDICKDICIDTNVKITPDVIVSDVESILVGNCRMIRCRNHCNQTGYFVNQLVNVRFRLSYCAKVSADVNHVSCNTQNHVINTEQEFCNNPPFIH